MPDRKSGRRWGFIGRAFNIMRWLSPNLSEAVDFRRIHRGGVFIHDLARVVRSQRRDRSGQLELDVFGLIDVQATAFALGMSTAELTKRIQMRIVQTRRSALTAFYLGWAILFLWLYEMLFLNWSGSRLLSGILFLPFCGSLFIFAFRGAWVNWQLRTRRVGQAGSAAAFLATTEGFMPRA